MDAISIKNLTKTYRNGIKALKSIDLQINKGDFFGLLGANGAGKTTIIGILTGIVKKSGGTIEIFGNNIDTNHSIAKKMIGVVPQEFNFSIFEKVINVVTQQAGYFGIPRKEALKNAEKILKTMNLWNKKNNPAMSLSGGMKRRLMIARALINTPQLLILDEPTAGVDVELRHDMWDYLKKINKEGCTILLTTHYLEEAEQLCKNIAIIKEGEIIKQDSVINLVKSLETQTYVLTVNTIDDGKNIPGYNFKIVDKNTIEVDLGMYKNLNELIYLMSENGITIQDIRPKGNRLEQLFLNMHKK